MADQGPTQLSPPNHNCKHLTVLFSSPNLCPMLSKYGSKLDDMDGVGLHVTPLFTPYILDTSSTIGQKNGTMVKSNKARHAAKPVVPGRTNQMYWVSPLLVPQIQYEQLQKQIKQATGIDTVLHFHMIHEVRPIQDKQTKLPIQVIHIEVDQSISPQHQKHIKRIYSPKAQTFLRGIKM